MSKYVIITDSTTDLPNEYILKNKIEYVSLKYQINGKEYLNFLDGKEQTYEEFYDLMRQEYMATTSQLNAEDVKKVYEVQLKKGLDILGIAFSSGLSGSFNSARLAVEELKEEYPERKIVLIDSLCASMGEGLLVDYALNNLNDGMSLEDNAKFLDDIKLRISHWFTVSDIDLLKRGGRVSGTAAFIAKTVKIQPILHVNNEGKLAPKLKKIGRKKALATLVEQLEQTADKSKKQKVFLSHGDSLEDATYVKEQIEKLDFVSEVVLSYIGPVIGAHSGPGTIAIFFVGSGRE